jgi:hypothetical protein
MPNIAGWPDFPPALREHLVERMRDRRITLDDLNRLRLWIESDPEVPEGLWYKDFGSFKLCGEGRYPKTFLVAGQPAKGTEV